MPNATMQFQTTINATPDQIFPYLSRMPMHANWAANALEIIPIDSEDDTPYLWLRFWLLYFPVRRPAGIKAMAALKSLVERDQTRN